MNPVQKQLTKLGYDLKELECFSDLSTLTEKEVIDFWNTCSTGGQIRCAAMRISVLINLLNEIHTLRHLVAKCDHKKSLKDQVKDFFKKKIIRS
jgi:hypothetical protein